MDSNIPTIEITQAVHHLLDGEATKVEQMMCGMVLKSMLTPQEPVLRNSKPYCGNCGQPLNTKQKNGMRIYNYCKVCGAKIKWGDTVDSAGTETT